MQTKAMGIVASSAIPSPHTVSVTRLSTAHMKMVTPLMPVTATASMVLSSRTDGIPTPAAPPLVIPIMLSTPSILRL